MMATKQELKRALHCKRRLEEIEFIREVLPLVKDERILTAIDSCLAQAIAQILRGVNR